MTVTKLKEIEDIGSMITILIESTQLIYMLEVARYVTMSFNTGKFMRQINPVDEGCSDLT
jgi:hypothetical protein